jgi:hypothetical protein
MKVGFEEPRTDWASRSPQCPMGLSFTESLTEFLSSYNSEYPHLMLPHVGNYYGTTGSQFCISVKWMGEIEPKWTEGDKNNYSKGL